jgi:RHS repeat-associated protein
MNRTTRVTHPDSTYEQLIYSNLDLVASCDRLGRWTTNTYNAIRQLVQTRDPMARVTGFDWCKCGALTGLTDPMGRKTIWDYDVQSRPIAKHYVDGSSISYTYENTTSRLRNRRDEKAQNTFYEYYTDNNLKRVSYPNATVATPTVTYSYDPDYNRLASMQDGIGTTSWKYSPVGVLGALQVSEVDGPWPNEAVTYSYDHLQRVTNCIINGISQAFAYDSLWRITNVVNALGAFAYSYDAATARMEDVSYPNGQKSHYEYFDNMGDRRLQRITHTKPDLSLISRFTYGYNRVGNITNWIQEMNVLTETWGIGYDDADQLLSVIDDQGGTNFLTYNYGYDPTGNRVFETTNGTQRSFQYNALNELVASSDGSTTNVSYEWDGEQRLTAINAGTNRSEFSYDGLGRRTQIIEKANGLSVSVTRFVWCANEMCQERTNDNSLTKQYFSQGAVLPFGKVFYTRDHLGSIRELTDSPIAIRAQYRYGPYGSSKKITGDLEAEFSFTGHYLQAPSLLNLSLYRAYDSARGRWLSRDPIEENAGLNLYLYVGNNPINFVDSLGLDFDPAGIREGLVDLSNFFSGLWGRIGDFFESDKQRTAQQISDLTGMSPADARRVMDAIEIAMPEMPGTKLGGRLTEPRLPPRTICHEKGVEITHYYRSGDHGPAHLHVEGGGPSTKIGQAGRPIEGSAELSATQNEVIQGNKSAIRKAVDQIQRRFRFENE